MSEMIRRFLRQKFGSPATILALCLLALMACLPLSAGQGFGSIDSLALLLLAAGAISRDASSGALQMILSRPIRRTSYLAGRYLGILTAFAIFLSGAILLAAGLNTAVGRISVGPLPRVFALEAAGLAAAHALLAGALLGAALLFFSTFLSGWGDVLAVVILLILFNSMEGLGSALGLPLLSRSGELAKANLAPPVPWDSILAGGHLFGEATGRYVLALLFYWTLALVLFSRREFSYGRD